MHIINANVLWGHLSENFLTQKFITRNICNYGVRTDTQNNPQSKLNYI